MFGEDVRLEAAYGDTDGDLDMLALAEEKGFKVFNGTPIGSRPMKHAGAAALDRLEPLLAQIRAPRRPAGEAPRGLLSEGPAPSCISMRTRPACSPTCASPDDDFERHKVDAPAGAQALVEKTAAHLRKP